jgi:hypothetical protein
MFKDTVRTALLALRDQRRQPGTCWAAACCWVPIEQLAAALNCDITSVLTALNKLVTEGMAELRPATGLLTECTHVRSLEL